PGAALVAACGLDAAVLRGARRWSGQWGPRRAVAGGRSNVHAGSRGAGPGASDAAGTGRDVGRRHRGAHAWRKARALPACTAAPRDAAWPGGPARAAVGPDRR